MSKGIRNFHIENKKSMKNIGDEDLGNKSAGLFHSNYMNKLINHGAMISEKIRQISLRYC